MIKLYDHGVYVARGERIYDSLEALEAAEGLEVRSEVGFKLIGDEAEDQASKGTMAYGILKAHNQSEDMDHMRLNLNTRNLALCLKMFTKIFSTNYIKQDIFRKLI